jgi:hypothetical protein
MASTGIRPRTRRSRAPASSIAPSVDLAERDAVTVTAPQFSSAADVGQDGVGHGRILLSRSPRAIGWSLDSLGLTTPVTGLIGLAWGPMGNLGYPFSPVAADRVVRPPLAALAGGCQA